MKNSLYNIIIVLILAIFGCDEDFLDKKPNKSIVVPTTPGDLQALLDNTSVMNRGPGIGILGADDFFMTDAGWEGLLNPIERNGYFWASDVFGGQLSCSDWTVPYEQVFYANVVMEGLNKISVNSANETELNNIKGRALFYRGNAFYQLAQLFCLPYSPETLESPGIPLRLTADVSSPVVRATVKETYERIVMDLEEADRLLPVTPAAKTQPSSAAGKALLASVYMSMEDYVNAEAYATGALSLNNALMDYEQLDESSLRPVSVMNEEVLFHCTVITYRFSISALTYVDTMLLDSYSANDLRKTIFFRQRAPGMYNFKGNYTGNVLQFGGISNNEVYLSRAECRVRNGNIPGALEDLNALLEKRWRTGTFIPVTENDPENLLSLILTERRKELVFRGSRWTDLRRLNQDERFQKTLSRELNGTLYTLPPNDPRYVYPIPPQEIDISGIAQNIR